MCKERVIIFKKQHVDAELNNFDMVKGKVKQIYIKIF